jgi:hypothetical protein
MLVIKVRAHTKVLKDSRGFSVCAVQVHPAARGHIYVLWKNSDLEMYQTERKSTKAFGYLTNDPVFSSK